MNKNYSMQAMSEAVSEELSFAFVDAIKRMDSRIAAKRLLFIVLSSTSDIGFLDTAGRFLAVENVKTCADE